MPKHKILASVCFFAWMLLSNVGAVEAAQERPNILFAFADDWGRHASVYAKVDGPGTENDLIRTPHFDALAQEGVLFNHAYVNAPSCTPCRSSLLSGQHFWRTGRGAILQGAVWDSSIPTWPLLLQDAGYHIGFSFKVWSPGTPRDAPFGGKANAYRAAGGRYNAFSQTVSRMVRSGKPLEDAKAEMAAEVRKNFEGFLGKKKEGQPFAYWFGPTNVHRKWIKGSGKALWNIDPDQLKGRMPPFLPDVPEVRQDLADYMGEAMAFDMSLGVLVGELKKRGLYDNTLIAVSGDHGPAGFPHGKCNLYDYGTRVALSISGPGVKKQNAGRVLDDFVSLPDLAPTFLEAAGVKIPKVMTARSIWPSLRSETAAGLADASRTQVFTGRERHVAVARPGRLPYPSRAIRTRDHLLIVNFRPDRWPLGDPYDLGTDREPGVAKLTSSTFVTLADEDAGPTKAWIVSNRKDPKVRPFFEHAYGKRPKLQLFDMNKDPHQMKNVADDPAYADVLKDLRGRLMAELETTKDPRVVDNGSYFENPPLAGQPRGRRKNKKRP
ncbi:MAG: sulfatase [Phycisphaeraceae bacterium]|nr:sulfatase [Phycisphaeraceae bacterium]